MNRVLHVLVGLFVLMAASVSTAAAGWIISDADGQEMMVSRGKMKSDWDNGTVIIDADNDALHFIDDTRKMIASGTVDEFCNGMKQMVESMMEKVPAEQREMMKQMMGGARLPKVVIDKKGPGEKLGGFETTRYEVAADGELYEELWLTEDKALVKDCEAVMKLMGRFTTCMESISSMGSSASPEASPEYARIYELGVILKSISHDQDGTGDRTEIMTITEKDLSDAIFALPDGYKPVSFETLWTMGEE